MIVLDSITKTYRIGAERIDALKEVSLGVEKGEYLSVVGPSGSGKSTLMNIIGCLDHPTAGSYFLESEDVSRLGDNALADVRNRKVGFVFQTFNLLPRYSAFRNVELPLVYSGTGRWKRRGQTKAALEAVELAHRMRHRPNELSGGERQRVAIARALVNNPHLLLADEPTGNLDSKTGHEIVDLFEKLNATMGVTVIVVTHNPEIARKSPRVVELRDGRVVSDLRRQG